MTIDWRKWVNFAAASGQEAKKAQLICGEAARLGLKATVDALGNVLVQKATDRTGAPRVLVSAPMDEPGFIVLDIEESGILRVGPIGPVDSAQAIGWPVVFPSGVHGVVGLDAQVDRAKAQSTQLFVDIGAATASEAEERVHIGEACTFLAPVLEMDGSRLSGPSLGSRVSVAILMDVLTRLQRSSYDVTFVFTAQSVTEHRGIRTAAQAVSPELGWVVSPARANDLPKGQGSLKLGKGPAVKWMDRGVIVPQEARRPIEEAASKLGLALQREVQHEQGSDAGNLLSAGMGVVAGGIGVPVRALGNVIEMVDLHDAEACATLLLGLLSDDGQEFQKP